MGCHTCCDPFWSFCRHGWGATVLKDSHTDACKMLSCTSAVHAFLQGPIPDVPVGDVYALLIEWCHGQGNMQQALQLVEQMMDRHVPPGQYLSPDVLAAVQQVRAREQALLLQESVMSYDDGPCRYSASP